MVSVRLDISFKKKFCRIKNSETKNRIIMQIQKIKENPLIGKPMRNTRKGTRELYISPFRLSYKIKDDKILILDLYHKDNQ